MPLKLKADHTKSKKYLKLFISLFLFLSRLVFLGDPNLEVINRGQVLKIKSARLGDQARYQCIVTNTAGKQSKDFILSVYGQCVVCMQSLILLL